MSALPDPAAAPSGPLVVLIGPPGSGKTTVAALLATLIGVAAEDTDAEIVAAQGRSISDIFVDEGEATFRELEHAALAQALERPSGVLSVGGGAVLDPRTQVLLERHTVVFLDVGIADAAGRVGFDRSRPLLGINPRAQWTRLMQARRPTYERLASLRVDTAGRTPEEVAREIQSHLDPATKHAADDG